MLNNKGEIMNKMRMNYSKLMGICAIFALLLVHLPEKPVAAATGTTIDINSEMRTLTTFVTDLGRFDKKRVELGKKESLTRAEFVALQNSSDELKRRLPAVNSTIQEIARKLKAAGQWDNLDATVLAKLDDPKFQSLFRRLGFKQILENAASRLSSDADEISQPLEPLRNRVRAQNSILEPRHSDLALRAVPVAYEPSPALTATSFRCRFSLLRMGLSRAFGTSGAPSNGAVNAVNCFCLDTASDCLEL
jgi:hypothetical protein